MFKTPENIPELILGEIGGALKAMGKSKSIEEKLNYSQIINHLSYSLDVFVHFLEVMADEEDFEDMEIPSA